MSEKTVHKTSTPHGYNTPHRLPSLEGDISGLDVLNDLSVQLYPTGRAWYKKEKGVWENVHRAVNVSILRLIEDGEQLINSTFPDNPDFSALDATLWEFRLGLITNEDVDLELRKKAIARKLGHPNNIEARQHPLFIESQLQLAGFNVFVHENSFPYATPNEIAVVALGSVQHGEPSQHGAGSQHGGNNFSVIANSIDPVESYSVGENNLWATFFIGGEILGSIATVPSSRLKEFKELVIKLKPAHTVAFTFINYS